MHRIYGFLLVIWFTASGCAGGSSVRQDDDDPNPPPVPAATGLWVNGGDGDALAAYRSLLTTPVAEGRTSLVFDVEALASVAASDGGGFTTTYRLEADVDEHDIVKYDGTVLAVAPSRSHCCVALNSIAEPALQKSPKVTTSVELFQTEPDSASLSKLGQIPLGSSEGVEGLYLGNGNLQILTSTAWWGVFGEALIAPSYWQEQQVRLLTYENIQNAEPTQISELVIEGALITSRRVGSQIHLVTRHTPVIEGLIPYPAAPGDVANNEQVLTGISATEVLPAMTVNGASIAPLSLDDCLRRDPSHPLAVDLPTGGSITSLITVSAQTGEVLRATCTAEPVSGVYVSPDYLVMTHVYRENDDPRTLVHLLRLSDLDYLGSESVRGHLYSGGNRDFRISEHDSVLRLVTTEFTDDANDRFDHFLYTLGIDHSAPELTVLGMLGAGEDELGKPNEDLYGVRFFNDRAYLVTFERIDPLYVISLADPSAPRVEGTLEVPGFSDLLHPVSDDLLLGLGTDAENYAKVELFNISDATVPVSAGSIRLGDLANGSCTPAQYDRHAFTYRAGESTDRFTVPYVAYSQTDAQFIHDSKVALLEVRDKQNPNAASLILSGEVNLGDGGSVTSDTRVILDDESLYIVDGGQIWAGFWDVPDQVRLTVD